MKKSKNIKFVILLLLFLLTTWYLLYGLNRIGIFKENIYYNEVRAASLLFNVDPILIESVMKRESNMNPEAISNKGAVGLMQIMPKTALEISEHIIFGDYNENKLTDPSINIMFGAYYLSKLLDYYNNNLILALAAYNAGIGNVDKWLEKDPDIAKKFSKIPFKETRKHVKAIVITYTFHKGALRLKSLMKTKKK
ncbi:MAG: lytic transglycosylase domain-containing protein [Endomicrobium sp.]|jgi:soluble lytic murein transglycosylase|nr:lytic transglycosylase domain-containing protein [Endomicrobium sp.]